MKDILGALHLEVHRNSKRLKAIVLEAWGAITNAEVKELVHTMHQRYQNIKDANGMYTNW